MSTTSPERYYRNAETGKTAKITTFWAANPDKGILQRYYVAFFNNGQLTTAEGRYCKLLRHAIGDAQSFIAE